jgi:hypothetical protein
MCRPLSRTGRECQLQMVTMSIGRRHLARREINLPAVQIETDPPVRRPDERWRAPDNSSRAARRTLTRPSSRSTGKKLLATGCASQHRLGSSVRVRSSENFFFGSLSFSALVAAVEASMFALPCHCMPGFCNSNQRKLRRVYGTTVNGMLGGNDGR